MTRDLAKYDAARLNAAARAVEDALREHEIPAVLSVRYDVAAAVLDALAPPTVPESAPRHEDHEFSEVCEVCGFGTNSPLEFDMHMEIHDDDER